MQPTLLAVLIASSLAVHAAETVNYKGLGKASITAETLEKFRAKPLDATLSRKVQATLDLRAPGSGVLAPDGKSLYFGWRVTGVAQVWRIDGPQTFPVQMTGGEDATSINDITPDGKWLVLSRDRKGEENPGIYLQAAKGGPLTVIQHIPDVQTFFEFISDDSRYVYYRSNDEVNDSYTFYRYELASGRKEKLFGEKGSWSVLDHRADGTLLVQKSNSNSAAEIWQWHPATGKLEPLLGQGEKEEFEARYGAQPGELIVHTNKFSDFRRLYRWVGGKFEAITPEKKWDVAGFSLDEQKQRLYYSVNEGGYTRSYALDAATLKPIALPTFTGADHVNIAGGTRDGSKTIVSVGTATAPRSSYVLDWKSGKLTQWVLPSTPEIDTARFAVASLESYPSRDGVAIPMFVRRPAQCAADGAGAPCPVVVHFHGGPEAQSDAGFSAYGQLFVDAGFIYVEPNVRGSDGYGKQWLHLDDGPKRLQVVGDIEDAAVHIRKQWGRNGTAPRIGVMGGSYGGYATMAAMTMFAGSYDAGVSTVGISNMLTFLENTAPYRRTNRIAEYGDPVKDRAALIQLSPTTHIDKLKDPLLIIQGASDPRVPVGEAVQMYEAANKKGIAAELIIFGDEGHGAQKRENQVAAIGHTLRFMERYLKAAK
ncbi:S9 family peptidase [Chitinimonas arctica]|uniref:S9 family peptidase n=1 Tax=Chitinimonas arctica TaxID=2594795 RepID=A0A516SB51_9NEIS|nr:prolyl oligopeptidase family serine peptidase [Chitinimonas arctica]QDQ25373.1 S9 family peptidase [Chitinimonas arctica]